MGRDLLRWPGRAAARQAPGPPRWRLVLLCLLLLATLLGADSLGWPLPAAWASRQLSNATGLPLRMSPGGRWHLLGVVRLELPGLELAGAQPGDPARLRLQGLRLGLRYADLWDWLRGGPPQLDTLQAQGLWLDWRRPAQAGPLPEPLAQIPLPGRLELRQADIRLDDKALKLRLLASLRSQADGSWQASAQGRYRQHALQAEAQAGAALPLLALGSHTPMPLRLALQIGPSAARFEGETRSLFEPRALRGRIWLRGPSLAAVGAPLGLTLPHTPDFELQARLLEQAGVWRLEDTRARIGRSRLDGDFRYQTRPPRPLLSGRLGGSLLQLSDLGPAFGTDRPRQRAGRVLPDRDFDFDSLAWMDADLDLAIARLDLGTPQLAALQQVRARLQLQDRVLHLQPLQADVGGGRLEGGATLNARQRPPLWQADLRFDGVELSRWVRALQPARRPALLSGRLQLQAQVQGRGNNPAEFLAALEGQASARILNGQMSHLATEALGLDAAESLFWWLRGDESLALNCAQLDAELKQGLLRPRRALLDNRDSRIELQGQVDLARERLDLVARVQPKDRSPLALRSPLRIHGAWAAPQWQLDRGRIGGKLLAAAALGALAPAAAWLPLVDLGAAPAAPCR